MLSALSLFGIASCLGSIPIAMKSTRRIKRYRQSQVWPKFHATIINSFIPDDSSGDGTSSLPEFAFRYTVAGAEYTSSTHTEGTPFSSTESDVIEMLQRFPVGAAVQVAVNPTDPRCAILDTGYPKAWSVLRCASAVTFTSGLAIVLTTMVFSKGA